MVVSRIGSAKAMSGAATAPEPPNVPPPQRRVLVIDDDAALRETIADGLRTRGHDVTSTDGGGAAELVRERQQVQLDAELGLELDPEAGDRQRRAPGEQGPAVI